MSVCGPGSSNARVREDRLAPRNAHTSSDSPGPSPRPHGISPALLGTPVGPPHAPAPPGAYYTSQEPLAASSRRYRLQASPSMGQPRRRALLDRQHQPVFTGPRPSTAVTCRHYLALDRAVRLAVNVDPGTREPPTVTTRPSGVNYPCPSGDVTSVESSCSAHIVKST
jgi:hypothetical protein